MAVDELTGQIISLQSKLKKYKDRKTKNELLKKELSWFMKAINGIDAGVTDSQEEVDPDKPIDFDNTLFDRIIKTGRLGNDGRIVYDLSFGVQWSINYSYKDYQDGIKRFKQHMTKEKKLEFLNGPVVEAMLEFCKEPKTGREMHDFISEQRAMDIDTFRKNVIKPLIIAKRLMYTIPEYSQHKNQKYYSDKP